MKNLVMTLAFTIAGTAAFAQATPETAPPAQQKMETACPMPSMDQVQTLNLEQEQLIQVRQIHAECERACAQAKQETGSVDKQAMVEHQTRIQAILTPEQYERYQALSAERKSDKKDVHSKENN